MRCRAFSQEQKNVKRYCDGKKSFVVLASPKAINFLKIFHRSFRFVVIREGRLRMSDIADKGLKDVKFFAKFFGIGERRVQQLRTEGIIKAVKRTTDGYLYETIPTIQKYIQYLQGIVAKRSKSTEELDNQRLEAEIRIKRSKAEESELKLKTYKLELLRAEDVRAFFEELAARTKSNFSALPGRLAMDLKDAQTPAEVSEIIEKAINQVLENLSEFEFTEEFFRERVMADEGRGVMPDGADESESE